MGCLVSVVVAFCRECPVTTRSGWSNGIWVHETTKDGTLFKIKYIGSAVLHKEQQ